MAFANRVEYNGGVASVSIERLNAIRTAQSSVRLRTVAGLVLVLIGLAALYRFTAKPVHVSVDGFEETVYTHRATVGALLLDLGLRPGPQDRIVPAPTSTLEREMQIVIERARPFRLLADGRDLIAYSWGQTPRQALADAGVLLETHDEVLVNGQPWDADQPLPPRTVTQEAPTYDRGFAWNAIRVEPLQIRVRRATPIVVHEGGVRYTIETTAQTIGEALYKNSVILYLGDRILPSLGSAVTANMNIYIQRSTPVSVQVDGRTFRTRTQGQTVADALSDMGIVLTGSDRVEPALDTKLYRNMKIVVTRVMEDVIVEEEIAPFETVYVPDPNLPIDTQEVLVPGAAGITRTRYRVRYENGEMVSRVMEDRWVAQAPANRRIAYGQKIEPRTETMPDGTVITYWRKIRMLATSYNAVSAGGTRTRTGDVLREGIVAVDPRIIPLRSQVYVPGYGIADALDTGGGIIGRRIDLAYEVDNYVPWRRWVDVYLLWPPPPTSSITWVVPNYPPVPQ